MSTCTFSVGLVRHLAKSLSIQSTIKSKLETIFPRRNNGRMIEACRLYLAPTNDVMWESISIRQERVTFVANESVWKDGTNCFCKNITLIINISMSKNMSHIIETTHDHETYRTNPKLINITIMSLEC